MCGRYTLTDTKNIGKRFHVDIAPDQQTLPNFNTSPGQTMPVIINQNGSTDEAIMRWGFIPLWAKDINIGYKLINTVSETCFEKPMWKNAVIHHRCLVPSTGFYEWKLEKDGKNKQPYFIHPEDQQLFAFAGLWSEWKDAEGHEIKSFSIITTQPNMEMKSIHNRMPVILSPDEENIWLNDILTDKTKIEELMHPYPDKHLAIYRVSQEVNNTRNNYLSLTEAV